MVCSSISICTDVDAQGPLLKPKRFNVQTLPLKIMIIIVECWPRNTSPDDHFLSNPGTAENFGKEGDRKEWFDQEKENC